jgi:hypothetical protein
MAGMNDDGVRTARSRLEAIRWNQPDRDAREGSQIALMREFLRRMALWAEALECVEKWPFFSVAEHIEIDAFAASRVADPLPSSIEDTLNRVPLARLRRICAGFVQWSMIESRDEVRGFDLPAPYAPAITMFERGGMFYVEQGMFQFFLASVHIGTVTSNLARQPLVSLDDSTLAQLDENRRREIERKRS